MIQIDVWSLVITVLYAWRRHLGTSMLMQIWNETFVLALAPMLFPSGLR